MLKTSLFHYSDTYILVSETIIVTPQAEDNPNYVNKKVAFKNCKIMLHLLIAKVK